MEQRKMYTFNTGGNPMGTIVGLLLFLGVLYLLFRLASFVLKILWWVSPLLLIATLIINRKVVLDYVQMIGGLFKRNPVSGGITLGLTIIGFPLVTLYLFGKAMLIKKAEEMKAQAPGSGGSPAYSESDLVDYEELESKPLDLPAPQRPSRAKEEDGKYDELFES